MKRGKENERMDIDKEKVAMLVINYAGCSERARKAQEEMDARHREACGALDELMEYLDKVNADRKAMEEELARLQKAEAERASIKPEPKPEHTCRECRYLQRGTKSGAPQCFCMNIGPEPFVDRNEEDAACEKFEPRLAELVTKAPVPSLYTHTCGECLSWAEDKMAFNGTGTCLNRNCETVKRGEMDPSCFYFEPREEPAAQAETPTEDGPEVSCMECKYAVREDVRTNTWHCSKGLAFMGFAKGRCSEYEEKPQESGTEGRRMCGTCKNCQPRGADPDIVECDHPTVGTIHIGRWSDACEKYEEAKP